ncbi:RidA family protein [Undibacterium sp. Ren11W]|uniref:RidA family protein n=1 Tax=Undibacterium sp. Ren11W TaxID=3413045 RepID=UPI003BF02B61
MNTQHNAGVAMHIGRYSDSVAVTSSAKILFVSGTPGTNLDGTLPIDFETQARLAWDNVIRILASADMQVKDIVKLTQTLIRREDLDAYRAIRNDYLGELRPASMLSFVDGLIWPEILIELELIAAR